MTDTEAPDRLYGTRGSETLYGDLVDVYQYDIEPYYEQSDTDLGTAAVEIEVYDVHPPRTHLPQVERLLEWIVEYASEMGEVDEGFHDQLDARMGDTAVRRAAEGFLDLIAFGVKYRMAADRVATKVLTWNEDRQPVVDGEALFVQS